MARRQPFLPSFRPGERVEIAPRFDQWMRGDRYGEVVKQSERFGVYVKMDKSGKTLRFAPDDLTALNPITHRTALRYAKQLAAHERASLKGKNPPTKAAQRFIGTKIRRLAREGMAAPRRVAAAYAIARRAGFRSVPKRARKNPRQYSERDAWSVVENAALRILEQKASARVHREAEIVRLTAVEMKAQLSEGVHTNPTLAILGNPPAKVVATLSRRLYELRYRHAANGKDYRHPFGPGATVSLLAGGSVWIHARHKLWEEL